MAWKAPHKLPPLSTSLTFPLLTFFLAYFAPATQASLLQPTQSLIRAIALAIPFAWNTLYSVIFMTPSILLFRSFLREVFLIILSKIALFPHSTHYYLASYPASFFYGIYHYLTYFFVCLFVYDLSPPLECKFSEGRNLFIHCCIPLT